MASLLLGFLFAHLPEADCDEQKKSRQKRVVVEEENGAASERYAGEGGEDHLGLSFSICFLVEVATS